MTNLKNMICSFALLATFASAACMAQQAVQAPQWGNHGPELGSNGVPVPPTTQFKRCEALGEFVEQTVAARDAGESEKHFVGRLGLNMLPPSSIGLIHRRLDTHSRAPQEALGLVHQVFASTESAVAWQERTAVPCERQITQS